MDVVLNSGQDLMLNNTFGNTVGADHYLGLMEELTVPAVTDSLGAGITEISAATGYARIQMIKGVDFTVSGNVAVGVQKEFTVGAGGWNNVNGWFLATLVTGGDATLAGVFSGAEQGNRIENDLIRITVRVNAKDISE